MKKHLMHGRVRATTIIVIAAVAAAIGLWLGGKLTQPQLPEMQTAVLYPVPRQIPEFHLQRADGGVLDGADWTGHWTVAFFGFTNCPDICPITLGTLRQVWERVDAAGRAEHLRVDFISVDPDRDTPETLASYVGYFHPKFVAATGDDEQLTRLTRSLGLLYVRAPTGEGDYDVDHSASAVIIDPLGRQAGLFRPPFDVAAMSADLIALIDSSR